MNEQDLRVRLQPATATGSRSPGRSAVARGPKEHARGGAWTAGLAAFGLSCGGSPVDAPQAPLIAVPSAAPVAVDPEAVVETVPDGKGCPTGMVRVRGSATLGMSTDVYARVETAHLSVVDAPEASCPEALAAHPDPAACWVQTDLSDPVVAPHRVTVDVCIDRVPFPGAGVPYTSDGMTPWDAQHLGELLATGRYNTRRLCSFSEFQAAVAGLKSNHRFVYGDRHEPGRCGGESDAVAARSACANPETGVHDYAAVLSHWVVADAAFVASACASPPCRGAGNKPLEAGHLVVAGGTGRLQTRQAPLTPHTWHDHGQPDPLGCDVLGHDDQPVICAEPDARYLAPDEATRRGEDAWMALVDVTRRTGRVTSLLEAGLGRSVCPESAAGAVP